MKNVAVEERRVAYRVLLDMEIEVCLLPGDDSPANLSVLPCRARDISNSGFSFYGKVLFREHALLRLRIPLVETGQSRARQQEMILKVMGKVMWSRKEDNAEKYATGVQFLNIYDADFELLDRYVQKMLAV